MSTILSVRKMRCRSEINHSNTNMKKKPHKFEFIDFWTQHLDTTHTALTATKAFMVCRRSEVPYELWSRVQVSHWYIVYYARGGAAKGRLCKGDATTVGSLPNWRVSCEIFSIFEGLIIYLGLHECFGLRHWHLSVVIKKLVTW